MRRGRALAVLALAICATGLLLAETADAQQPQQWQQQEQQQQPQWQQSQQQAPPALQTQAPVAECFPACRAGYVCQAGQCVSACNPPCGPGQQCTPQGCTPPAGVVATGPTGQVTTGPNAAEIVARLVALRAEEERQAEEDWQRRVRNMRRVRFGVQLEGGWGTQDDLRGGQDDEFTYEQAIGPAFGLHLVLQQHLGTSVAWRARLGALLLHSPDGGELRDDGHQVVWYEATGLALRFGGDLGVRLGPMHRSFPAYIDLGVTAGVLLMMSESTPCREGGSGTYCYENPEYGVTFQETYFLLGPAAGLGVMFGNLDQFDVGLRFAYTLSPSADTTGLNVLLGFGWLMN